MGNAWTTAQIPPTVSGKTAIVTGANSGTGYFVALGLAQAGVDVIMACRNKERGEVALKEIKDSCPSCSVHLRLLDLSSQKDVKRFAKEFNEEGRKLDILVNNAGIMRPPYSVTEDGFESQLAANHLGHFALTGLLLPSLERSEAPRVVAVSSIAAWRAHKTDPVDFAKTESSYNAERVYSETKLANLLFMKQLAKKHPKIMSVASHPGITASNLWKHNGNGEILKRLMQSSENGALPLLRAATEPLERLVSGQSYFAPRGLFGVAGYPTHAWFPKLANDEAYASLYWKASEEATGVVY